MLNQIRIILSLIIITALLLSSALTFGGQPAAAAGGEELDLTQVELAEKGDPKLESRLNQLVSAESRKQAASFAQQSNIELVDKKVRVIVECAPGLLNAASQAARALGASVETSYRNRLQVLVPITSLTALANTPAARFVRLPYYPLPSVYTSEGVAIINADDWHDAGYTGTGVKVAILDGGFTGYAALLGTELPSSVTTQSYYAGSDIEGYSVHGTACAEIVYDIAPDADFYLVNFGTDVEMGYAVDWLIAQGVDVISYSMGWPIGGPGDGTGTICEMVSDAHAAGIFWSSSAGNSARTHWQGDFDDPNANGWHEFAPGVDETNTIGVLPWSTIISVALKWDDTWGASSNDYDLYLLDNALNVVAYSTYTQDGDDDPTEFLSYTATPGTYHIAIYKYLASSAVNFHLYSYYHNLESAYQVASRSLLVPADSANATAVGAVFWNSSPPTLEAFSSQGPTEDNRTKPDLVAPDGVSTATYGASAFGGTSASAPHVAGAAVLVKEYFSFYTPTQIQSFLEGQAVDLGAAGKDNLFGSGRLSLGAPPPTWQSYSNPQHTIPCDSFESATTQHTVYMYGVNFTASHNYRIAYYDGSDNKTANEDIASGASGNLTSQHTFSAETDVAGTWHTIVCETSYTPPDSYNSTWAYTLASDNFTVAQSAIPEFPTVVTAVVAFSLCAGVYLWMRRKAAPRSALKPL